MSRALGTNNVMPKQESSKVQMSPGRKCDNVGSDICWGGLRSVGVSYFQQWLSDGTKNIFVFIMLIDDPRLTQRKLKFQVTLFDVGEELSEDFKDVFQAMHTERI